MGAASFSVYGNGADPQAAFREAHEQASFEHGHGGYTGTIAEKGNFFIVTNTPMTESEADAKVDELMDWQNDSLLAKRVQDKWGDAGAIPVIRSTRTATVSGFEYTEGVDDIKEVVKSLLKLNRGEEVQSVWVSSYRTPNVRERGYSARTTRKRTDCSAQVTIKKPPLEREVSFKAQVPVSETDYDALQKALKKAAASNVRLKEGEKVVQVRAGAGTPGKAKVEVVAPKAKAKTRFVIVGDRRYLGSLPHGKWESGFDSQSEARAWLTKALAGEIEHVRLEDNQTFEIVSITRRETGEPLVTAKRAVGEYTYEAVATVSKQATGTPEAWLFFGYASS